MASIVLLIFFHYFSVGPLKHTLLTELFNPEQQVRVHLLPSLTSPQGSVAGLVTLAYWSSSCLATKLFKPLATSWGLPAVFLATSGLCLASVVFTASFIPETRDWATTQKPQEKTHLINP